MIEGAWNAWVWVQEHPWISLCIYFLPTIFALAIQSPRVVGAAVCNLLIGWSGIGWILAVMMAWPHEMDKRTLVERKQCKFCAEPIRVEAIVCRHCGRDQ